MGETALDHSESVDRSSPAHEIVGTFVGADLERNAVIFGKNTTEAINKLSYRIPLSDDSVVITTMMEHHSNDLPWRGKAEVTHVDVTPEGRLDEVEWAGMPDRDEAGVGVRSGCFCAHPYVVRILDLSDEEAETWREQLLGGDKSNMPGMVRMSFGCYTNKDDVDRLADMLERISAGEYSGDYKLDTASGEYIPVGYHEPLPDFMPRSLITE